tara:strand:- start:4000 stop:5610 length:1611 start_codon:yes stop_codon:yes gene_type:complete
MPQGPTLVPAEVYYSREFFAKEMEQLWMHVWQMACHEDDLSNVGDHMPYDIGELSFLIVRTGPDEFKAYRNACLHRGRRLKERPGKKLHEIRCPFHAWAWNLDGSIKEIPCEWDFPGINKDDQDLPEVPVGRWGRFIFINPDPNCESFEDFLDDFPSNFELLPYEKRHKVAEVRKVLRANWKVAQDAFAESWHVFSTHPQVVWGFGDCNAQFDAFKNYSRQHNPSGAPSPHLEGIEWTPLPPSPDGVPRERHAFTGAIYERRPDGNVDVTMPNGTKGVFTQEAVWVDGDLGHADLHLCQWVAGPQVAGGLMPPPAEEESSGNGSSTNDIAERLVGIATDDQENGAIPDGSELYGQIDDDEAQAVSQPQTRDERVRATAELRARAASDMREAMRPMLGDVMDTVSDTELTGNIYFNLFPNLMPCASFGPLAIWFRFRPNGSNPEECIMEAICIAPTPEGTEPPPAPPVHVLDVDDSWTLAPEIGGLAMVMDQDTGNMPWVQKGVRSLEGGVLQLADYNEIKLRHFYKVLNEYLEREW